MLSSIPLLQEAACLWQIFLEKAAKRTLWVKSWMSGHHVKYSYAPFFLRAICRLVGQVLNKATNTKKAPSERICPFSSITKAIFFFKRNVFYILSIFIF